MVPTSPDNPQVQLYQQVSQFSELMKCDISDGMKPDMQQTPAYKGNCEEELPKKPVSRLSANCQPFVGQQTADSRPTVGRQTTNSRPTVSRQ